jgi:hypothetical protein
MIPFGTEWSEVQILSPRPILSVTYAATNSTAAQSLRQEFGGPAPATKPEPGMECRWLTHYHPGVAAT